MLQFLGGRANPCSYCAHSHTAAAWAKGMTEEMYADLLRVVVTAGRTKQLLNGLQVPVDEAFRQELHGVSPQR